jgi:hypothetical protein
MANNNSFNDKKLPDTFIWVKKMEQQGLSNAPPEHLQVITAQRIKENKVKNFFCFLIKKNTFILG